MLKQKNKRNLANSSEVAHCSPRWNEVPFHFLSSSLTALPCLPLPSIKHTYTKLNSKAYTQQNLGRD